MLCNNILRATVRNKKVLRGLSGGRSINKLITDSFSVRTAPAKNNPSAAPPFSALSPYLTSNTTCSKNFSTVTENKSDDKNIIYADIVRKIKAELIEADVNSDGKIDSEELKIILKKHSDVFSDRDVLDIADLFYTGRGGASVSHETFLAAIERATGKDKDDEAEGGVAHRRTKNKDHPLGLGKCSNEFMYGKHKSVYTEEELDVKLTHIEPTSFSDKVALKAVHIIRFLFDTFSLWKFGEITQAKVFRRVIFLETVAAVPGFVAAMVRHFKSLRNFTRDGGMLNMFLDEANNERMHLLTFVRMRDPHPIMKYLVLVSQTFVGAGFLILYNIAPDFCHRFVGYVEEEACHTYTTIIKEIEDGPETSDLKVWKTQVAPAIARGYWHLGEDGTVLDLMYAVRADEAEHRDVNHLCSGISEGQVNPIYDPAAKFDQVLKKYVEDIMKKGKD